MRGVRVDFVLWPTAVWRVNVTRFGAFGKLVAQWNYITVDQGQKGKVKLSLCLTKHHAMKAYRGNEGIAPRILDLGTRWRWVVSFTVRPLYPQGKNPWYPLDRTLGGPQSRSGRGGEEKNSQPLSGLESPHQHGLLRNQLHGAESFLRS
jgi:hypothetical protein